MRTTFGVSIALVVVLLSLQFPMFPQMAATLARRFLPTTASKILPTSRISSQVHQPASRTFASATSTMAPNCNAFFDAVKARRTMYQLSNESTIPDSRIKEIVNDAMLHTPSSFNSQTTRMVVLLKEHHVKMWDATTEVYKQQLPEDKFKPAKERFDGFRAAYGTVRRESGFVLDNGRMLIRCGHRSCSTRIPRGFTSSNRNSRCMRTSSHNVGVAIVVS